MKPTSTMPVTNHGRNFKLVSESMASMRAYIDQCCALEPPTREEEHRLFVRLRSGDESAREELILRNQRFVLKAATYFAGGANMPVDDLLAAGNLGLMEAIDGFDHESGNRLMTYAAYRVRARLQREAADSSRSVRVPPNSNVAINRYRNAMSELIGQGIRPEAITHQMLADKMKMSQCYVAASEVMVAKTESLNKPVFDDARKQGEDQIDRIMSNADTGELAEVENVRAVLRKMLSMFPKRTAEIIAYRFGLDDDQYRTFDEVGLRFGLSRERIRQILVGVFRSVREMDKFDFVRELAP